MSKSDIAQRMDALRNTGAKLVVAEYLKERLDRKIKGLLACTPETFEAQKGRCLELQDLINYIEGKG